MMLWRLERILGRSVIERAINGDPKALEKIENFAWRGRKRPALVLWVEAKRKVHR